MCVPVFHGETAGSFVPEGNTLATDFTYDAPCFILAFRRCERGLDGLCISVGRAIWSWGRLALAGIADRLVSTRGDGSERDAHEGAESDEDAGGVTTVEDTFLVGSAGTHG